MCIIGIARQKIVNGTPQQNGLAERLNRTLLERIKCMIITSGVSKIFWEEATKIACYLVNRCRSSAIDFKIPQEKWIRKPADYDQLKVFGCTAYAHLRQDKLEPRAKKCIFTGYPEGVKGYKLWCIEKSSEKCIINRDVVFNELEIPLKSQKLENDQKDTSVEVESFEIVLDQWDMKKTLRKVMKAHQQNQRTLINL